MIEISLTSALAIYSGILAAGTFAIWIYTAITVQRGWRVLGKQYLWRCRYCGFSWLDEDAEQYSECPRCGSINSAGDPDAYQGAPLALRLEPERDAARKTAQPRRNPAKKKRRRSRRGPRRSR
jgi:hypothetical protein